jgi:hypothetical protein
MTDMDLLREAGRLRKRVEELEAERDLLLLQLRIDRDANFKHAFDAATDGRGPGTGRLFKRWRASHD